MIASVLILVLAWGQENLFNLDPKVTWGQGSPEQVPLDLPKCLLLTNALAFLTNPNSNRPLDGQVAGGAAARVTCMLLPISLWPQELVLNLLASFPSSPPFLRLLLLPGPARIVLPSTNTAEPLQQIMWQTRSARTGTAKASTERNAMLEASYGGWRQGEN